MQLDAAILASRLAALTDDKRAAVLRELVERNIGLAALPLVPMRKRTAAPLSIAQRGLWLTWSLDTQSAAYNMSGVLELFGALDQDALLGALCDLVERQQVLRTIFPRDEQGEPVQAVLDVEPGLVTVEDASARSSPDNETRAHDLAREIADAPFDLEAAPPRRFVLIKVAQERHWLVIVLHHIIADGLSQSILLNEIAALYAARVRGGRASLPAIPVQFADYALWEREWYAADRRSAQLEYWKQRLSTPPAMLALPHTPPDHGRSKDTGGRHHFILDSKLSQRLVALAQEREVSVFMMMLALLKVMLARFSNQSDICVGSPMSSRRREETQALIGYFIDVIALRSEVDLRRDFSSLLNRVRATVLEAYSNQECPLVLVMPELAIERGKGRSPLFRVKCAEQPLAKSGARMHFADLDAHLWQVGAPRIHFDLSFDFEVDAEQIECTFTYAADCFDESIVARLARAYLEIAEQVIADPRRCLASLKLSEMDAGMEEESRAYPSSSVLTLWSQSVGAVPLSLAVRAERTQLDYLTLDLRSSALARRLCDLGVVAGDRVGIAADRSAEFVLGMLAVLKAGGAYVPLDPRLPAQRLRFQLTDSRARLLLSTVPVAWAGGIPIIELTLDPVSLRDAQVNERSLPVVHAALPAYVIYTSGSTGQPKGVVVTHGALANYVQGMLEQLALPEHVKGLAMVSTVAADLGHTVLFGALCSGRTLHMIPAERVFDPERFAEYIREHQVDLLKIVPSHLQALMSARHAEDVLPRHTLILGGEPTSWALLDRIEELKSDCRVINHYGPTETTVGVFTQAARSAARYADTLPIGAPLPNAQGYVLDTYLDPVPQGVAGELYVGGPGLAQAYLERPGLTAERFIASPFRDGERLYRTGDLMRLLGDGSLEFLGRVDDQVKVRGYRVELQEVANALKAQPAVREAVVIVRNNEGRAQLYGYVVAQPQARADSSRLRDELAKALPDYMVPSAIMVLDALPLTPNGKVDRKALPEPDVGITDHYEAPRGEIEQTLARIWADLLKVERVGRNDNFFELGGDSILTLQAVARARKHDIQLSPRALMERQSIAAVAAVAERVTKGMPQADGSESISAPFELTPIQRWFFEQHFDEPQHWNQSVMLEATETVDVGLLRRAVRRLIEHHGALRLAFHEVEGQWQQSYQAVVPDSCFETIDLSADDDAPSAITAAAGNAQRTLTLQQPFRASWLDLGPDRRGRLLLTAHHLVVDAVSWRVLLEDLQSLYTQLKRGGEEELPAKTASIEGWARTLREHAQSKALLQQHPYWAELAATTEPDLPSHNPAGSNTVADEASVSITLDELQTGQLLTRASQAYRAQIDDLLLTALAQTLCEWGARDCVLIELERHGRQAPSADVDLTRTVGWFTSLHPVRLTPRTDIADSIKAIKEQLRRVPDKGLGYGVLRYLTAEGASLARAAYPQVTFNYLGQFDQALDVASMWRIAPESVGQMRSPTSHRRCRLDVRAHIHERRLVVTWSYSRALHAQDEVDLLLDRYRHRLQQLLEHCTSGAQGMTPSDFPLAQLTQADLDSLSIPAGQVEDLYPMTPLQQGLLFHSLHDLEGGMYVSQVRVDIDGLDVQRFEAAWRAVVERHAPLRTGFLSPDKLALQWVARDVSLSFTQQDVRGHAEPERSLDELARSHMLQPFDLAQPPLMRFALIRTHDRQHRFIWTHHHLLTDGWSTVQVISEVLHFYHHQTLPQPRGRYRDYIEWLRERDAKASEQYWKAQLRRLEEPTRLANALPGSAGAEGYVEYVQEIDVPGTRRLVEFAKRERVTLNTLVQGAWALLLSRCTGRSGVTFGATTSGRPAELPGVEQLVGLFISTFPVIAQVTPGQQVGEWLRELQAQNIASREHEHTPLYEIQRWANRSGQSLFDVVLAFQNFPVDEALRDSQVRALHLSATQFQDHTHYPLLVQIDHAETIRMRLRGRREFFSQDALTAIGSRAGQFITALCESPQRRMGEVELLAPAEQLTHDRWSTNARRHADGLPVQRLIERQVEKRGARTSLVFGSVQLSYAELNARANRLAHHLIGLGVGPEVRVGLAMQRSPEMVVSLLAILKAGGAYVPLDPQCPAGRLGYLIKDSGIDLLLTQRAMAAHLPLMDGVTPLHVDALDLDAEPDRNPDVPVHPNTLAYVIYTSGSTGRPKGVMVRHGALTSFLLSMRDAPGLADDDVLVAVTSLVFDISALEMYLPLVVGARIVLATEAQAQDGEALARLLRDSRATVMQATPASWRLLLAGGWADSGRVTLKALCGGEALQPDLAKRLRDAGVELWNMYGPTETTIWSSAGRVKGSRSWLGRPIAATQLRVLSADLQPAAAGMIGELYIAGVGLARGYLNRAALTSERFIADPFSSGGERLYRTGDLVRWSDEGQLEYLGRIDHQVKIRGYRIELGEIEAELLSQPAVREAAVVARDGREGDGSKRLIAYVVATQAGLESVDIEAHASQRAVVRQWESVFESAYGGETSDPDFRGWNSSYTDQPIPAAEMQEWLHATVDRLSALGSQGILEIGCGVGLLVQRLAPKLPVYVATDISARAVRDLRRCIETQPSLSHVEVAQAEAADLSGVRAGQFDTVVLNSVVQYFPSADYLMEVLRGAARLAGTRGRIFVGDVRHLAHLPMFHASVQFMKAPAALTIRQLRSRIHRAIAQDKELVLDPGFFHAVAPSLRMAGVEIMLRRGRADNELTRYRYDVVLRALAAACPEPLTLDWATCGGLDRLAQCLATDRPASLHLRNIPNGRVAGDLALWRLLQASEDDATVADVRTQLEGMELAGVDPEDLWALAEQLGYTVRIGWSLRSVDGCMDAEFVDSSLTSRDPSAVISTAELPAGWRALASDPLRMVRTQELQKQLRDRLGRVLPDYMVPSAVVVMEALPLNASGKLDRKALPEPEYSHTAGYEAPTGEIETALAAIWSEVLGVDRVGRNDNFFDLGGHSLTAMQVLAQVRLRFSVQLPLRLLFELPSLAQYSAACSAELQQAISKEGDELDRMTALLDALEG